MIRLSDLRTPGVALEWHEAVAVAAAFTTAVWHARQAYAPSLEGAMLTPEGEVELAPGGPRAAGSATNGLAAGLAGLLESTPCPAELRQIVTRASGRPPQIDSVQAFSRALMFFERPSRDEVLRALAARAVVAIERARASQALEQLTERARHAEFPVPPPASMRIRISDLAAVAPRVAVPASVAITVFLVVAFAAATLFTTAQAPDTAAAPRSGPIVDDEAPGGGEARAAAKGLETSTVVAPGRATTPAAHGVVTRVPGRTGTSASSSLAGDGRAAGGDVLVTVTEIGGAPLPVDATVPVAAARRGPVASRIFSAADRSVAPAVLVKPHLPAEPPSDVPPWEVGTLELTVSTTGTVEQVHLISPYNRYQERMLVAAAKAWQFRPATKDGRPVRFQARIRVTL